MPSILLVIWSLCFGLPPLPVDLPHSAASSQLPQQGIYSMLIKDTLLQVRNRTMQTFAVNGQFPPRMLQLKPNDPATVHFQNATTHDLWLSLPKDLVAAPSPAKWVTILPGQAFSATLRTHRPGVYNYRIARPEQKGNGLTGVVVIR
jgi:hypothetical protein